MAKVSFSSLKLKVDDSTQTIKLANADIVLKNYLPVNEKLDLISTIINESADDLKFYNVGKIEIFKTIELIKHYTNINFTDKQLEDPTKLYDMLVSSGIANTIIGSIHEDELNFIDDVLMDTVDAVYKYQNSVMGILDIVTKDYENLNFDVSELQKNISDPNNLTLLKDIVTKLG